MKRREFIINSALALGGGGGGGGLCSLPQKAAEKLKYECPDQ